ncbi:hypothetical protein RB653_009770 [Dictyostelium firmibasis]|uniref:Uncharacterized protein n=1 Tax=Dictyostelium firmibasis TaxID=79012 RepID=A0AAN7TJ41_9MYCE
MKNFLNGNEESSLFNFDPNQNSHLEILNGENALQSSINSALSIFSILKTSLGPRSMSKLIIKDNGQYIISNDGATILSNIKVEHPAAVILVNIALSQDREIGDGTTSIVLLAGEILKSLTKLYFKSKLEGKPIHQTTITKILYQLLEKVNTILDSISVEYDNSTTDTLFKLAGVALGTKHYSYWTKSLTSITIDAIQNSMIKQYSSTISLPTEFNESNRMVVDIKNNIQICKLQGGNIDQSCFRKGLIIKTKQIPSLTFINRINVDSNNNSGGENIKLKTIIIGYDINKHIESTQSIHRTIKSTQEMSRYYGINDGLLLNLVDRLIRNNVNLVFFRYKVTDFLAQLLYSNNISMVQDFNDSNENNIDTDTIVKRLSILTNSIPIMKYDELDFHLLQQEQLRKEQLGKEQQPQQKDFGVDSCFGTISNFEIISKFEDDFYIYLNNNFKSNRLSCIMLRGPTKDIVDDLEIGIIDSLYLIKSSLESTPMIVYGGGCCEMAISMKLLEYSNSIDLISNCNNNNENNMINLDQNYWKKEISKTLSECFQIIPSILVMNAYNSCSNIKSPLETIAELSTLHSKDKGTKCSLGIDGWTGEIKNMKQMNIIEPLILKKSIIVSSIEAVIALLRIDTIVSSSSFI